MAVRVSPPDFLLVRNADHVILGVRWSGMTVRNDPGAGSPVLVATADGARLVLVFPPQHIAEETSALGSQAPVFLPGGPPTDPRPLVPSWRAALSGPSQVAFAVPRGATVALTVTGLLAAAGAGPISTTRGLPGSDDTVVEMPWGLLVVPENPNDGAGVFCLHPVAPVVSPDGVAALWRTRIVAGTGNGQPDPADPSTRPAGLYLQLLETPAAGPDPFGLPLSKPVRAQLVAAASSRAAGADELELSALGGTLEASGDWDTFAWRQRTVGGRDLHVRTSAKGQLYPLGHDAVYTEFTERVFDPSAGGAAVLRTASILTITDPVRQTPRDGLAGRAFPFDQVAITARSFTDLGRADWRYVPFPGTPPEGVPTYFQPTSPGGGPLQFALVCTGRHGTVRFSLPLLFVRDHSPEFSSLTDPGLAQTLADAYGQVTVPIPASPVDLVRAASPGDGDTHEVHGLTIGGLDAFEGAPPPGAVDGYRPLVTQLQVAISALRTLLGDTAPRPVTLNENFLRNGPAEDVLLELSGPPINVDFSRNADRSGGLVSPVYQANGISRRLGPVNRAAQPAAGTGLVDPRILFPDSATILGFGLRDLVSQLKLPPALTAKVWPDGSPDVTMRWTGVALKSLGPFVANPRTRLDLTAEVTRDGATTVCAVHDFALELPPGPRALLRLSFTSLTFSQRPGGQPDLDVEGLDASFLGDLRLLEKLQEAVDLVTAQRILDLRSSGIAVRYSLPLPPVAAGAFVMRDIAVSTAVDVPFDGRPVSVSLGFARRDKPFALAVLMFGGGGYIDLMLDRDGLRRLEISLEFGAMVAVDFVVARGEVHALGGIRFALEADGSVSLTGYLRIGGSVEVLGLISVSVELRLELTYQSARKAMVGRASVVVEIDLTLWSDRVEIDSGEWVLAGGGTGAGAAGPPHLAFAGLFALGPGAQAAGGPGDEGLARWRDYRAAFAPAQ